MQILLLILLLMFSGTVLAMHEERTTPLYRYTSYSSGSNDDQLAHRRLTDPFHRPSKATRLKKKAGNAVKWPFKKAGKACHWAKRKCSRSGFRSIS